MSHKDVPYLFSFSTIVSGIIFTVYFSSPIIQNSNSKVSIYSYVSFTLVLYTCIIDLSDDIKKNPGPRSSFSQNFSISHWNLKSKTAHSYVQISLLKAYLSIHKFHIVCFI